MIGNTKTGYSFKGCVNYNLEKVEKGNGRVLEVNGVREERGAMIRDFNAGRDANPRLNKSVWHTSLSFQDKMSDDQILQISKEWIKGMGLDQTQYAVVRHTDTEHAHVHIIASRISDSGKTISDSNNWDRSQALCTELIQKYQLTPVPAIRNEQKIDRNKLHGRDLLKTDLNRAIKEAIPKSKSMNEFSEIMKAKGFDCIVKYNPDTSIRGVSFERDGLTMKASDVNKYYAARSLETQIQKQQTIKSDLNVAMKESFSKSKNIEDFSRGVNAKGFKCNIQYSKDRAVKDVSFEKNGFKMRSGEATKTLSVKNWESNLESRVILNEFFGNRITDADWEIINQNAQIEQLKYVGSEMEENKLKQLNTIKEKSEEEINKKQNRGIER